MVLVEALLQSLPRNPSPSRTATCHRADPAAEDERPREPQEVSPIVNGTDSCSARIFLQPQNHSEQRTTGQQQRRDWGRLRLNARIDRSCQ